jgi:hypothetical protein
MLMRVRPAPRNPIIPGTTRDRTGAGGILRRAGAAIRRRFELIERDVRAAFDRIPVYALNDERNPEVRYGITPQTLSDIANELQAALERWLLDGTRSVEHAFWWDAFVQNAAQLGTVQTMTNLAALSPAYAAARTLTQVLFSPPYLERIATAKFKSYEHWTGLAAEQRAALAQLIGQGIADGQAPRVVRRAIAERLGVGLSKALEYAQSDITDTLRMARVAEAEAAEAELGLRTALLWTSALIPTTRPWHASRHGRVYTPGEVRAFYADRGNRYRCRCATTECLLDEEGAPMLSKKLKSAMASERKAWQSRQPA